MKQLPEIKRSVIRVFLFSCLLITGSLTASFAQPGAFTPVDVDPVVIKTLADQHEKVFRQELASLPTKNKKDYEEVYRLRWDNIKSKFDNVEIYTSPAAQAYLDALVAEIVKANPALQSKTFRCYFSRSGTPNASYIGEGIILFNMGLFHRLDNESEVAFVISHEIAHFYLKHSENNISAYVATVNSEEVQKQLRKIKGTEYKKRGQLEKLVKGLTFDSRRHGRDHESEADSMAVELMRHTRFDISKALSTLNLLDSIDTDTLNTAACLQKLFNAKEYPFQKKWIAKEDGLLGGHAQLKEDEPMADSLKTHPDCKSRIKRLEPMIEKYQSSTSLTDVIDRQRLKAFQNSFRYEVIEYAYSSGNYCRSLYHTMELLQKDPSDPYLVAQTGKIFNGLYTAQKSHTLGKVTDLPSPYYPSNYNLLLQFIQNLYLENFAGISYHFLKQHHPQLGYFPPFKEAYKNSLQIAQQ
jgi:Zn-dependent protease with chaperone function